MYRPKSHLYLGTSRVRAALIQSPTSCRPDGAIPDCVYTMSPLDPVFPVVHLGSWSSYSWPFSCHTLCFCCLYIRISDVAGRAEREPPGPILSSPVKPATLWERRNKSRSPPHLESSRLPRRSTFSRPSHARASPRHLVTYTHSSACDPVTDPQVLRVYISTTDLLHFLHLQAFAWLISLSCFPYTSFFCFLLLPPSTPRI